MRNAILMVALVVEASVTFGADAKTERTALIEARTGGILVKPNSGRGKIAVVDAQKTFQKRTVQDIAASLRKELMVEVDVVESANVKFASAGGILKRSGAAAGVILVDAEDLPTILVAPDNSWALVNALAMQKNEELFKKEAIRAFAMGAGAYLSQMQLTLMGPFKNQRQIAAIPTSRLPADAVMKVLRKLKESGVEPYIRMSYRKACQEGWAPNPTNDVQRGIWEKVHAPPKTPMHIKFDPATQKGRVTK